MSDDQVNLRVYNYPAREVHSDIRSVTFGPATDEFQILISVDPSESGGITLTVGNGPDDADLPQALSSVFRELADIMDDLEH